MNSNLSQPWHAHKILHHASTNAFLLLKMFALHSIDTVAWNSFQNSQQNVNSFIPRTLLLQDSRQVLELIITQCFHYRRLEKFLRFWIEWLELRSIKRIMMWHNIQSINYSIFHPLIVCRCNRRRLFWCAEVSTTETRHSNRHK